MFTQSGLTQRNRPLNPNRSASVGGYKPVPVAQYGRAAALTCLSGRPQTSTVHLTCSAPLRYAIADLGGISRQKCVRKWSVSVQTRKCQTVLRVTRTLCWYDEMLLIRKR